MARQYCTADEVRQRSGHALADRGLVGAIEAATARIENETKRIFEAIGPEAREFEAMRDGFCVIEDALSITQVALAASGSVIDADLYVFRPAGSTVLPKWAIKAKSYGLFYEGDVLAVTATWGYSSTPPEDIRDACIAWVIRSIKQADAGYTDATAIPELGKLVYSQAIPAEVRRVLENFTRRTPVFP